VLKFLHRVATEVRDPILGRETGFYLFALPLYDSVYWLLVGLSAIGLLAAAVYLMVPRGHEERHTPWWERGWTRQYRDY
jgi:uncharacterized membrane protein (UPF0182 family)